MRKLIAKLIKWAITENYDRETPYQEKEQTIGELALRLKETEQKLQALAQYNKVSIHRTLPQLNEFIVHPYSTELRDVTEKLNTVGNTNVDTAQGAMIR